VRYGIDPAAPLADWLTPEDRGRVDAVASEAGLDRAILAPLRPWLASQVLTMASESKRGIDRESSPEAVLRALAQRRGLRVRHEFPTPESVARFFSELPRAAEVELLRVTLDNLQAHPERDRQRAAAWLEGDLDLEHAHAVEARRRYPAFYEHLALARNRAWLPRVTALLDVGNRAFLVVGVGHVVGPGSLIEEIEAAGMRARRDVSP
jgi:uncharacterized protein YbaP (TraB family)